MSADVFLQEAFLEKLQKQALGVTVFLVGGVRLTGEIKGFDRHTLILQRGENSQLIYKHAISTIMPDAPLRVDE